MKHKVSECLIVILCSVLLFSFKGQVRKTKSHQQACEDCFKFISPSGKRFGDISLETTEHDNFLKYRYLNGGKVVFSCGKGQFEYIVDTIECRYARSQEVFFDNEDIIILIQSTGSDTWDNTFVLLNPRKKPTHAQALYIDTVYYKFVDIKETKKETYFVVHDLIQGDKYSIKSNYSKYYDGYPSLHIFNVQLKNDTVFYSIKTKGKIVNDTVYRE